MGPRLSAPAKWSIHNLVGMAYNGFGQGSDKMPSFSANSPPVTLPNPLTAKDTYAAYPLGGNNNIMPSPLGPGMC